LPPVREVLCGLDGVATVVIDAHVWLGPDRPGLGARLHEVLGGAVAVIGIAKNAFAGAPAIPVVRNAARPLYVSAIGLDPREAAARVVAMHGPYRIPTLVRRADQLARGR
jgi:deoxyribonuclease V